MKCTKRLPFSIGSSQADGQQDFGVIVDRDGLVLVHSISSVLPPNIRERFPAKCFWKWQNAGDAKGTSPANPSIRQICAGAAQRPQSADR
jgi:hypothetical protein